MSKRSIFANALLGSIVMLFLSMFLYTLVKSSSYPPGHMNTYYFVSIAGCLLFTYLLLKCGVELKVKIALLVLSLIVSIYAIEIILSYSDARVRVSQKRANYAEYLGIPFDSRTKMQVMMDLRAKGADVYAFYNPTEEMKFKGMDMINLLKQYMIFYIITMHNVP